MKVYNAIKRIRIEKGISQVSLAKETGLSEPTIRNIEQNIYSIRFGTLQKVANALDVNIKDLFKEVNEINEVELETYESLGFINKFEN